VLVLSGLAAWALRGRKAGTWTGVCGALAGCAAGFAGSLPVLLGAPTESLRLPWHLPLAGLNLAVDPLSAFFLLPTFALSGLAALYGAGYLHVEPGRRPGAPWLAFNLLVASMALVIAARNGILFLVAWEVMTIASWFLVTLHHERPDVRRAGRIYLVATHVGTAFLLVLFLSLAGPAGSLDFDGFAGAAGRPGLTAASLFLLAVVGFGTKAGFMPFHMWLPEAHPAAPAHVSAVMSGVMIKLGIYGLLRVLPFLGPPPAWWGWLLVAVGLVSGVLGVLYALAQHELKRLLAYHSIENIGIIACGLGLGLLGVAHGAGFLAVLGFSGALLHVWNHAAFKGLLFLGAGSVLRGAGTGEIEHLGGLMKRMPWTGAAFLTGAIAISGLPPLNGFVSEFLIYLGSFRAAAAAAGETALAGVAVIGGLALIGGFAAACFVKAFGITFLGEPRGSAAREARESGALLRIPMTVLALACLAIGLASPWILPALGAALPYPEALPAGTAGPELDVAGRILVRVSVIGALFLLLAAGALAARALLLARRRPAESVTWDCGYALPTARMQYTASSFAQPILELFAPMLGTRVSSKKPVGFFPEAASHATATPDSIRERVLRPIGEELARRLSHLRRIQEGRVQVYVLYIAATLIALLVYQFLVNP
jgi:formate hydrogenlyase subunit 3/multisubunit Na+/H+ antiporter MnhD subunit